MLTEILDKMRYSASNDDVTNRRSSPRRKSDSCVTIINGQAYPVEDWSHGGVLINGDSKTYSDGQPLDVTMKFKLSEKVLDIPHAGKVIRRNKDHFAIQFAPLTKEVSRQFQHVIDDSVTREFADSQRV